MTWPLNWQLTSLFPEFGGAAYEAHWTDLESGIERLETLALELGAITPDNAGNWAEVLLLGEQITADYSHLLSYLHCLASAHADNQEYKAAMGRVSTLRAKYSKAYAGVMAAFKNVDDTGFHALAEQQELADITYFLQRLREEAARTMDPALEVLAADLGVDGLSAWGRLYDEVSGKLEFPLHSEEGETMVPMAQKRGLLESPDPDTRRQVLQSSNQAWESVEHVVAACLNHISGTRLTLNRHRGVDNVMTVPLFEAGVEQATINAMWDEVAKARNTASEYGLLKAKLMGKTCLGFQDLPAPLPGGDTVSYEWDQAVDLVLSSFHAAYPALGDFAEEMIEKGHVEAEKRPAKRPGAFCTTSLKNRESRVFMTFGGGLGDVKTLAHELGHAFHSRLLKDTRPFAARYPMTLAETASTFAERLLQNHLLDDPATPQTVKQAVLGSRLDDSLTFLCDIPMRYFFEQALYAERGQGEVPLARIKELVLAAQQEWFGPALDPAEQDPMFWASKLHFYVISVSFYNFPYTFGYLLSLWIASSARAQGSAFLPRYEEFLRLTGGDTAENVAHRALDQDISTGGFWRLGLDEISADLARFRELIG